MGAVWSTGWVCSASPVACAAPDQLKFGQPRTDAGAMRYILAGLVGVALGLIYYPSPWGILVAALVSAALSRLFTLLGKVKQGAAPGILEGQTRVNPDYEARGATALGHSQRVAPRR
jgi:hypothetical protein